MTLRAYQPAFVGGELSPALWARVDTKNYAVGLKTALNLTIQAHGGANNRAGLEFVGEVKASGQRTRLIPFQFNESQSEQFAVEWARVHYDGKSEGGDDLGNIIGPDGEPLPPGTHPDADGQLLFWPTKDCWQLEADTRWRR